MKEPFEPATDGHTGFGLQSDMRGLLDDTCNILLSLVDGLGNVGHGLLISDGIADTNTEPVVEKPEVHDHLIAVKSCRVASGPFSRNTTCTRPPCDAPTVFFSTINGIFI